MRKLDARKLPPSAQETLRLRIADFLKAGKGTQEQAAHIFQVSLPAVKKIWKQFKEGGKRALKQKKRGPQNSHAGLSAKQITSLKAIVKKDTPDQQHIPRYLWTAAAVRLLIKKKPV